MSLNDARSFLERVAKDEEFRRNLIDELGSADASPQKVVEVGSQSGVTFSEAELAEALATRQATSPKELSDSELEAVSGGTDAASIQMAMSKLSAMMSMLSSTLKNQMDVKTAVARDVR
jgi:predicted ribosomally synthesized peptide with nif11-like leader